MAKGRPQKGTAMRDFIRSFTENIDSSMSIFSARSNVSLEDEQRIRFFTLVTFLAIPICICFFALHLRWGNVGRAVLILLAGSCQLLSLLAVGHLKNAKVAFRISSFVLGVYFLFLMGIGGSHGTRMLWMLVLPAYFFFLLGKREGFIWTGAGFLASLFVLFDPTDLVAAYDYEANVAARFLVTYGLITAIAYFGESIRQRYADQLVQVQTEKFQTLCANAPFGMVIIGEDGTFEYANPKFKEIFGYDLSEVPTGRDWFRSAYPDSAYRKKVISAWIEDMKQISHGETRPRIFDVMCKDGHKKIIHFRPVKLAAGKDLMTCEDITDRVHAEKAFSEHLSMLESILHKAADGICVCHNVDDFPYVRFTHWNPRMTEITGYNMEEINHAGWYQTMYPDAGIRQAAIDRMASMRLGDDILAEEWIITTKDVTEKPLSISTSIIKEENGKIHVLAIMQDIAQRKKDEAALLESEERFRSTFEQAAVGICHVSLDGLFLRVNQRLCDILGYTSDELLSLTFQEITHSDDLEADLDNVRRVLADEIRTYSMEKRYIRKDGSHRWANLTVSLAREPSGAPKYFISVVEDISDRKTAEEALRESEEFNRRLVQHSPMGIIYLTVDGEISFTNPACNRIFDVPEDKPSPLIGLNIFSLPLIADQPHIRANFEELVGHAKIQREIEFDYRSPLTGRDYILLASATPRPSADGAIIGSIVMIMDITGRKRAEQQLQLLYAAVEQAAETIVVTDPAGTILYVNPAFEVTTGYDTQEAAGQNPRILKSGHQDKLFYESLWKTISTGQVWRGEFTNRRKDGSLYQETATISPIKNAEGRVVNYVAVKRDITDEAMLQKQLLQAQKMEAVGTLAGGIAHDFNNLLQAILGYSEILLMKKELEDPDRKKLEVIQHAARDGADLVSRILAFSKKSESKIRPIDLNQELRRIEGLLRRTLPQMIKIELVLSDDLRIIDADPAQIEQVVLNLAVNAQHAMRDGGQFLIETCNVSISDEYIRTHLGARKGKYVLLTVSDTGTGMIPEVMERIFEPFFTTKINGEGTGLGLSMVHGIVTQHGGYVRCYSEPGKGASFKIYLPVSKTEGLWDLAETREMPAFGTETIFVVDDDDRVRDMAQQMIEMGGYKVITASSGEEALEIYEQRGAEIALVILDLIMPGGGGKRCLEDLLQVDPNVRVIIASGLSSNGLASYEIGTGARGFVMKPYDAKDILRAIRKVLDQGHL